MPRRSHLAGPTCFAGCAIVAACLLGAAQARAADTWSTPHPGIRHLYRTTGTPWRIHALVVDLCADGVSLRATKSGERQRTVSSFGSLVGAEAAVNADFFSFTDYSTSGLAVGDGARWPDTADTTGSGFLAFGDDRVLFSPQGDVVDPPPAWMRQVVSGHPRIVTAGVPMSSNSSEFCSTRHPRTAAGFSQDRRTLILAVVDGRSSISVGMQCTELATLMDGLGAWDATNLDGGGSTTMWIAGDGVVNDPSDGAQRVVANHLAVLASGTGDPGSCDRSIEEASHQGDAYGASLTTDVDGDGRADLCARAGAGWRCHLADGAGFPTQVPGPELSNDLGWDDAARWSTIRMADLDGDGQADLCARGADGVTCWPGDAAGFGTGYAGPALTDDSGWAAPQYYGTLRMADVDGDGLADLCVRAAAGLRCYRSTAGGFAEPFALDELSNDNGWDDPSHYGTIRMADVDGDGLADLCARAAEGMRCWRSLGDGFDAPFDGPDWADDHGWSPVAYWSTIRLTDLDGDGRADLCARAAAGFRCHLSDGTSFGEAITGPEWSDASGWADHANYSTIRLADIDGDGDEDLCARANAGMVCALWNGAGFDASFAGPTLSDDSGWGRYQYYSTIRLVDVTGDRMADVCARAAAGMRCWPSTGTAFGEALIGPEWSNDLGWAHPQYYGTLRAAGPQCRAAELCDNDRDDDCNGVTDDGCDDPDAGVPDGGAAAGGGATADGGEPPADASSGGSGIAASPDSSGGCGCRGAGGRSSNLPASMALVLSALWLVRRPPRPKSPR